MTGWKKGKGDEFKETLVEMEVQWMCSASEGHSRYAAPEKFSFTSSRPRTPVISAMSLGLIKD